MNIIARIIRRLRSTYLKYKYVDSKNGIIRLATPYYNLKIVKEEGSTFQLNGKLIFMNYFNGTSPVYIHLGKNSKLKIDGNFTIGDGVKIQLFEGAELLIGGTEFESTSGITSNCNLMVYKNISIGKDFLCSWNVYITDCDWHKFNNNPVNADVIIGNHVWIGNNCSILKGTNLGNNVVLSSYSKVINRTYPNDVLLGGVPAEILKENICWQRDI